MIEIKSLSKTDIPILEAAFAPFYAKPASIFERYLQEEDRKIWLARLNDEVAGYITLKRQSKYKSFTEKNIPEIMDLNVISPFRNRGIASKLLDIAEAEAAKVSDVVGLGVGLYKDYSSAQKLYINRGYFPDGNAITYNYMVMLSPTTIKQWIMVPWSALMMIWYYG